ncbi:MAG: LemA family protein [Defluviitaleaceae bacterium]|nr:LemA family protein [Defluviitaleaceae bacterium]
MELLAPAIEFIARSPALVIVVLTAIFFIIIYSSLASKRNRIHKSLSNIDAFLQYQLELMTNLFMHMDTAIDHEADVYTQFVKERTGFNQVRELFHNARTTGRGLVECDKAMSQFMQGARMTFENYPELRALDIVSDIMHQNTEMESQINASRRQYNSNVTIYRNAVQIFPNNLVAGIFRFTDTYEL